MQYRLLLTLTKYLLLGIFTLFLIYIISSPQIKNPELGQLYTYQCDVVNPNGKNNFNLYIPTNWQVSTLAQELCNNTLKNTAYSKVTISWQPRGSLNSDVMMAQNFDVMLYREHALVGLLPNWTDFYQVILNLPNYSTYWFSHQSNMAITADYFANKQVGLLADKNSASGYLSPMSQLSQAGISLTSQQIHLYPSREALVADFIKKKLDVIPSVDRYSALINWPKDKKRPLKETNSKVIWIISNNTEPQLRAKIKNLIIHYQQQLFSKVTQHKTTQTELTQ
ncbi:hypothetical protein [Pseudoalteromonas sp.]|uniref:hypothetical protein n=1 Tax=Pseudoalteromonas sp. TaxID=53249 RepID=UPI003003372C